jgi:NADPH-dependent 2,4-dienoyl-CoA reductase/sulfur reductase-like enzyme
MQGNYYDVAVIGSGAAGLASAIAARKEGAAKVLIIERDTELGGILLQCIHTGFGGQIFKEDLAGPAFAQRLASEASGLAVEVLLDSTVLELKQESLSVLSNKRGLIGIQTRSVVLAMGCRERTRAQINLPGTRPAGVFTAGAAQRFVNIEGYMPGKRFVILGSGDIGMVMARRLTLEGAKVQRVLEIMPFLSGLNRNYVQCLQDFNIPLQLGHTVNRILGQRRVEAVETVQVDSRLNPVDGTEEIIPCDTLLLSVGLIPENELSKKIGLKMDNVTGGPVVDQNMETSMPGVFAAGNVVHVYDMVDWVAAAGFVAGKAAAKYAAGKPGQTGNRILLMPGENIRYIVPQFLNRESLAESNQRVQMRVQYPVEERVWIEVLHGQDLVVRQALRYVRPGEMVTVDIPQKAYSLLQDASALNIRMVKR